MVAYLATVIANDTGMRGVGCGTCDSVTLM